MAEFTDRVASASSHDLRCALQTIELLSTDPVIRQIARDALLDQESQEIPPESLWQDKDPRLSQRVVKVIDLYDGGNKVGYRHVETGRLAYSQRSRFLIAFERLPLSSHVNKEPAPMSHADLIHRLRSRAMIEAPPDNEPDTRAAFEDVPEITFEELAEIAALLTEAADALESSSPVARQEPKL